MKNFQTSDDAKAFSIALNKIFKENNLNSKQSMILEALAKVEGVDNWNILSAMYKNTTQNETTLTSIKQIQFPDTEYFHVDNGGFYLSFSSSHLMIKTTFYGYTENTHYFNINSNELSHIINALHESQKENQKKLNIQLDHCVIFYENGQLILENNYNKVSLSLFLAPIDEMIIYFEKLLLENKNTLKKEEKSLTLDDMIKEMNKKSIDELPLLNHKALKNAFPHLSEDEIGLFFSSIEQVNDKLKQSAKTYNLKTVLNNMAFRYRHDFGLFDENERNKIISYVKQIYHGFDFQVDEMQLKNTLKIDEITLSQLKEEFNYQTNLNSQENKNSYKM